jgi:hypothetical protein
MGHATMRGADPPARHRRAGPGDRLGDGPAHRQADGPQAAHQAVVARGWPARSK